MNILIVGATSAIATATARIFAQRRDRLFLMARNSERLAELTADLKIRGAESVGSLALDLDDFNAHALALAEATHFLQQIDVALLCHGVLPDQATVEVDFDLALKSINTNGLSVISLLTEIARSISQQGFGTIAVITSVAGMRGRQPNYVYGAAKALVSVYLQGLRGRLHKHNVHVIDIKPGLVDSPMTARFEKGPLWSSPELVAEKIVSGIAAKKHTVYAPGYWRYIMYVVTAIPEIIFKRMKL